MDAVILAAGRNDRLAGLVAEGMKPLMLVNGKPIIIDLLDKLTVSSGGRIVHTVIVASPVNVQAIVSVLKATGHLSRFLSVVIQPEPVGPVDALRRGFETCPVTDREQTLVLCGDNIIPQEVMDTFVQGSYSDEHVGWIAVRTMDDESAAKRFTRVTEDCKEFHEGINDTGTRWRDGKYRAWLGPVLTYSMYLDKLFEISHAAKAQDAKLSRMWERLVKIHGTEQSKWKLIESRCQDIGVPEALPAYMYEPQMTFTRETL